MIVCPSIAPTTMAEARRALAVHRHASLAELRIDGLSSTHLDRLFAPPRPPIIVTNRSAADGGNFTGSFDVQEILLAIALRAGAEFVDVEFSWGRRALSSFFEIVPRERVILSSHNFERTPSNLHRLYAAMRNFRPGIIKIATMARDISDNERIFSLLRQAKSDRQPMIALCMGEHGEISRILGGKFGAWLSYSAPDKTPATAAGQVAHEKMERLFRAGAINRKTKIFGLIGNPVSQSHGVYFHNNIFRGKNLDAVYLNFLTVDPASFMKTIGGIIHGASVTMPFKEAILPYIDRCSEDAAAVSAVNTIIRTGGRFCGHNTDLPALRLLLGRYGSIRQKRALVVGTGAMARTALLAAVVSGAAVTVTGRSTDAAARLAREYGVDRVPFRNRAGVDADIIVNTTPVGMRGGPATCLFPDSFFRKKMLVIDTVYREGLTPLVRSAQKAGCRVVTGDEIFEAQAHLQSQLFLAAI